MHLHIAIPAMNELEHLPLTIASLQDQTEKFTLHICVNQPDNYRELPEKRAIYENNQLLLQQLQRDKLSEVKIIDHSSPGKGWNGKQHGVGQARKVLMDTIAAQADDNDLMISLDADTLLPEGYLSEVKAAFCGNPKALGLSAPYYHRLTGDARLDRSILRYEIYMRHYLLNLFRIGSPYAFTALGSALAVTVKAYNKIGGMTPKLSGEDFYFLQKIRKSGGLLINLPSPVYPAARYSDRVFFGTGPALIRGSGGDWNSYPIYACELFDNIKTTCDSFPALYNKPQLQTPLDDFCCRIFKEEDIWQPLRKNSKKVEVFIKACHDKLDGLRILQYLKDENQYDKRTEEEKLADYFKRFHPDFPLNKENWPADAFSSAPVERLNEIRDYLFQKEEEERNKKVILG